MTDAPYIAMPSTFKYIFWTPWLKGYWGQIGMTWSDLHMYKHFWIDQSLKQPIMNKK